MFHFIFSYERLNYGLTINKLLTATNNNGPICFIKMEPLAINPGQY